MRPVDSARSGADAEHIPQQSRASDVAIAAGLGVAAIGATASRAEGGVRIAIAGQDVAGGEGVVFIADKCSAGVVLGVRFIGGSGEGDDDGQGGGAVGGDYGERG